MKSYMKKKLQFEDASHEFNEVKRQLEDQREIHHMNVNSKGEVWFSAFEQLWLLIPTISEEGEGLVSFFASKSLQSLQAASLQLC